MYESLVNTIKKLYGKINSSNGILIISLLSLLFVFSFSEFHKTGTEQKGHKYDKANENPTSATIDTFIPKDHVLIPIEIENAAAIDALIGSFSLADLYKSNDSQSNAGYLVVSGVKLVRAPLDPREFAVLVHRSRAKWLMQIGTRYRVLIQKNPSANNSSSAPIFYEIPSEVNEISKSKLSEKTAEIKNFIPKPISKKSQNEFKTKIEYQN